jgi:hypothetical protein
LSISGFSAGRASHSPGTRAAAVSDATLTFEAEAGRVYELQWTQTLGGEWTTLRRWTADDDGETTIALPGTSGCPSGFFRLAAPEQE